jgi:hypothetical protein
MGLRDKVRTLERMAEGQVESFELLDGSHYYYDHQEAIKGLFLHSINCLREGNASAWPEPPEIYLKVCEAKDPTAVLERFVPPDKEAWFIEMPYERDALIHERRLVPIEHERVPDLSE